MASPLACMGRNGGYARCQVLLLLLALAVVLLPPSAVQGSGGKSGGFEDISAIFMFGDSIVDPGNNNHRLTEAKANFPPYGQDFPGRVATGRFSNGLVPGDLLGMLASVI